MDFKTYQFNRTAHSDFQKTLRKRVNNYFKSNNISKHANGKMITKTVVISALYFVPFIILLSGAVTHVVPYFLLWLVMGFGAAGIGFSVMHDANHGAYSSNKYVNTFFGHFMNIVGANSQIWKLQHNVLHHTYTNINEADHDLDVPAFLRFSPHQKLRKVHKYQHIYAWPLYGFLIILKVFVSDFQQAFHFRKVRLLKTRKEFFALLASVSLWKAIYFSVFLVLPMIIAPFSWWVTLIGFLIMLYVIGFMMAIIFQAAHVMPETAFPEAPENGKITQNWTVHQLITTTNFAPNNKLLSWYVGGLNFQVEHHLFPNICHVHYKALSKIVRETAEEFDLPYNSIGKFREAVAEHAKMLYMLGNGQMVKQGL
jgi:linoleoyl-CoA desaturase